MARQAEIKRYEKETLRLIFDFYEDELQDRIEIMQEQNTFIQTKLQITVFTHNCAGSKPTAD